MCLTSSCEHHPLTALSDYLPLLVRVVRDLAAGGGLLHTSAISSSTLCRCQAYDRVQEVGNDDLVHNDGRSECCHSGVALHLPTEEAEPDCARKARE